SVSSREHIVHKEKSVLISVALAPSFVTTLLRHRCDFTSNFQPWRSCFRSKTIGIHSDDHVAVKCDCRNKVGLEGIRTKNQIFILDIAEVEILVVNVQNRG